MKVEEQSSLPGCALLCTQWGGGPSSQRHAGGVSLFGPTRTVSSWLCWQVSLIPGSARVGPTHRLLLLFVLPVATEMVEVFETKESALATSKFPSGSFFLYLNDIASSLPM